MVTTQTQRDLVFPMIAQKGPTFLPGFIKISQGKIADYRTLSRFHYAPGRPAVPAAVICARWFPHTGPPRVVGVAVLSYPSALNASRHFVFALRAMRFGQRLRWVNANLRTISRVVVHPQFRSIGLSTGLIRAAVAICPTPYVEAAARMGRAHPMFERAGFARVEPLTDAQSIYFWRETPLVPSPVVINGRGLG